MISIIQMFMKGNNNMPWSLISCCKSNKNFSQVKYSASTTFVADKMKSFCKLKYCRIHVKRRLIFFVLTVTCQPPFSPCTQSYDIKLVSVLRPLLILSR